MRDGRVIDEGIGGPSPRTTAKCRSPAETGSGWVGRRRDRGGRDGRYFGEALNIAARIQAIADVGGINVTEAVYTALDEPALRLIGRGPRRLENIPERVRVYPVANAPGVGHPRHPEPLTQPTVAVMPTTHADDAVDARVAAALRLDLLEAAGTLGGRRRL